MVQIAKLQMAGCRSVSSGNGQEIHGSVTVLAEVMTDFNAQLSLSLRFTVMKADMCKHLHVCFLNDNSRHHFTYVLVYTLCWGTDVLSGGAATSD